MSDIENVLEKVGMNTNELKVYEVIVAFSFRTAGQISSYTDLSLDEVILACQSLIEKKFLKEFKTKIEGSSIYLPLAPKIAISGDVANNLSMELNNLSVNVSSLWNNAQISIDQDITKLIKTANSSIEKFSTEIKETSTDHLDAILNSTDNFRSSILKVSDEASKTLYSQINIPMQSLAEKLGVLETKIIEASDESLKTIDEANVKHKSTLVSASNLIKEELDTYVDSIGLFSTGRLSGLSQQLESTLSEETQKSEVLVTSWLNKTDDTVSMFSNTVLDLSEKFPSGLFENFNEIGGELKNHLVKLKKDYGVTVNASIKLIQDASAETIVCSKKVIDDLVKSNIKNIDNLHTGLSTAIKTVQNEAVTHLGKVLSETSNSLTSLKTSLLGSLKTNENKLKVNLSGLQDELNSTLEEKFNEIETQLANFVEKLKSITSKNVDSMSSNFLSLKEFIVKFLSEVYTKIKTDLQSLLEKIDDDLKTTLSESNEKLTNSKNENIENLDKAHSEFTSGLKIFQDNYTNFASETNDNLNEQINSINTEFQNEIDSSFEKYNSSINEVNKLQKEQLDALKNEIKTVSDKTISSKDDITEFLNKKLVDNKNEFFSNFNTNITTSTDNYSKEFNRIAETLEADLRRFYEEFNEKSSGLRDSVPDSIESLFVDQLDRMDNFRRDYQRVMGHALDTLNNFMNSFSKDGKKIDKKQVPILYGDVTRALADFKSFDSQINTHFTNSIENTEDTKDDLLAQINKVIQDELSGLEDLVVKQGNVSTELSNNFINSLNQSKGDYTDSVKTGFEEPLSEFSSSIKAQLLSTFQQPLQEILSQAQSIATGTEGADQENRMLKSQNKIISEITDILTNLKSQLSNVEETSTASITESITNSQNNSIQISNAISKDIGNLISSQKKIINQFSEEMISTTSEIQTKINGNLKTFNSSTLKNMDGTIKTKTGEVTSTVEKQVEELKNTNSGLHNQLDEELLKFIQTNSTIFQNIMEQVEGTITNTNKSQKESLAITISDLNKTTENASKAIAKTQTSLKENVGKPLTKIETDVKALKSNFDKNIELSKTTIEKDIGKYFAKSKKYITDYDNLKSSASDIIQFNNSKIDEAGNIIKENISEYLSTYIENFQSQSEDLKTKLTNISNEIGGGNSSFILELFDQVNSQLSMLQIEINENVNSTKEGIDLAVTNAIEEVRADIVGASSLVGNVISQEKEASSGSFTGIIDTLKSLDGSQSNVFEIAKVEFVKLINDTLNSKENEWKQTVEKIYTKQNNKISDLSKDFETKISTHSSSGKEDVTNAISQIPIVIDQTLDAAARSMKLLNEISKGTVKLEAKFPEVSYFDASKEAILSNLNAIITRTKSSLTIVCPTISWFDEKLIGNLTRIAVKIITDTEQHTSEDTRIIDLFRDKGVNLDLRKLDRTRYRGDIDMIMATRDKEEVILSKLPTSNHPYAFVSQDEAFVEKFTELFAPFHTMPKLT